MDISSPGQVSSLVPDPTRPNAPAKPHGEDRAITASTGGVPQNPPASVVTDTGTDVSVSDDRSHNQQKQVTHGVDITV